MVARASDESGSNVKGHLVVQTPWTREHAQQYENESVTSLGVNAGLDLSFLETLPGLRSLTLAGVSDGQDHKVVERCSTLEALTLATDATDATSKLDLRGLSALRTLHAEHDRIATAHLTEMPSLRELRWTNYPDRDLTAIAVSRTISTVQLDGVRRLHRVLPEGAAANGSVMKLDMAYGRGSVDAAGLLKFGALTSLSLQSVRMDSVAILGRLTGLQELGLVACGSIADLEWVRGLTSLAHVALHETLVLSGDLSPLDDLPLVQTRYVQPRRGYNRVYNDQVTAEGTAD